VLVVGCGYVGRRMARRLAGESPLMGVVRSREGAEALAREGIAPLIADLDAPSPPPLPLAGEAVFYFAPPPRSGRTDPRMARFLDVCERNGRPRRIVYISTTGVYGDCSGEWVDETRPVAPVEDRAWRRVDAERRLRRWSDAGGGEVVILRVPGIYGPGRLPLERLRKGLPLVREQEAPWTNRIHVDDLVGACLAGMERGRPGEIYHAADGHPSTMVDYFNRIADLTGLPRPPQIPLAEARNRLSPGMLAYMRESRRIDNRRLREELGVELQYPTLEKGLPACVASPAR